VRVMFSSDPPTINGPAEMTLAVGYHDTYTNAYNLGGTLPITVVKKSGHEKITWDEASNRLKIAAGLPKGTYPVELEVSNPSSTKATLTFTLTVINNAVLSGEVTIEGTPKFGETLSVDTSKLTIIPAITVTGDLIYEWRRSGSETIIGSESTYIISKEDIGKTITVTVKATDCDGFVATSPVNVEKADGSVIAAITGGYTGNGVTFTYRVNSIDNAEYSMDGIQWQESNEFDGFTIDSSPTTFYARIKETQTHKAGPYASIGPVTFIKLDNPQVPILDYTVSQEGDGRSINIMPVDNAEYKFGDEPWSGVFSKGGYIGGETVTIHIRYKETGTHNASMPNSITVNLEKANQEAPPVFKLNYTYNKKIGVFRVWIPEIPGAEYSFDGIVYDQTRTKIAAPGTTVTAYMRMKATQSHNESPAVSDTVTLPIFATSIIVSGMNGKSSITTKDGALQMLAKVLPEGASQDVIWSIVSGTGASINTSGLLQATGNGTVIVRATATDGTDVYGEMQVSISGQSSRGGSSGGRDSSYYERRSSSEGISQIEIKVFENNVTAIITVKETNDRDGNWVAPFSLEQISDAVDKAMKEAEKIGEGAIVNVVLKVEATANATTIENITPKEAVTKASKAGINSLTISTPVGSITFDSNTISDLSEKAAGDLKIKINRVDASSLLPEAQQIVGDRPVYDIIVTGGDKSISQFGGNVTVSVSYTPKEGEDTNAIVIYYINASGQLEVVTNGKYDPVTGMVTFTTRHFSKYAVGYHKIDFKDVDENAWYSKAVSFIAAREITTGTGDGNFNPEAKLTRGQFIVMFMKAYGIAPDTESKDNFADAVDMKAYGIAPDTESKDNFADAVDTYYSGYLAAAKGLSISNGVGYNMFEPEKEITRQEMFTLLYNGLKAIARLPVGMTDKSLASFVDADSIEPWAKEAMKYLVVTGIIGGSGDKLNPTKTTTRGEMVQVLYNLLTRAN